MEIEIFFGGKVDAASIVTKSINIFNTLQKRLNLEALTLLSQVHGINGKTIKTKVEAQTTGVRQVEGDYLILTCKKVGIGVLTADCLPLVLFDSQKNFAAIIHAGWRGAAAGIVKKVVKKLQDNYASKFSDLQFFLGPCAKKCCYQVSEDFLKNFVFDDFAQKAFIKKENQYFFDLVLYVILQLEEAGIKKDQINLSNNHCTICTVNYCSYRRQKGAPQRNITVVSLK